MASPMRDTKGKRADLNVQLPTSKSSKVRGPKPGAQTINAQPLDAHAFLSFFLK